MGGANSTGRNLTVVNDEAEGAIKISDSVIDRLRAEIASQQLGQQQQSAPPPEAPAAAPAPPPPPEPAAQDPAPPSPPPMPEPEQMPPPPPLVAPTAIPTFEPIVPPPPPPSAQQQQQEQLRLQRPIIQYVEEPSLSSLRIRAEKEQELADTERYWKQRMAELDKEQSVLTNLQSASMSQSVKEMSERVGTVRNSPVCPGLRESITACLQANKGTPLVCSPLVKEFSKCVDASRLHYGGERSG